MTEIWEGSLWLLCERDRAEARPERKRESQQECRNPVSCT